MILFYYHIEKFNLFFNFYSYSL